jgi:hypothetical protein
VLDDCIALRGIERVESGDQLSAVVQEWWLREIPRATGLPGDRYMPVLEIGTEITQRRPPER